MRVFIAIELPADIKLALAAVQSDLRQARAEVSWARPESLHLTLKCLGEVAASRWPEIVEACAVAAARVAPFALKVGGAGGFPNLQQPRVLWVGLTTGLVELRMLQQKLEATLQALGWAKEARTFNPHLTLGHVKTPHNLVAATARLLAYPVPELPFQVQELVVMQSQLHPAGSIYTPLAKCDLNG